MWKRFNISASYIAIRTPSIYRSWRDRSLWGISNTCRLDSVQNPSQYKIDVILSNQVAIVYNLPCKTLDISGYLSQITADFGSFIQLLTLWLKSILNIFIFSYVKWKFWGGGFWDWFWAFEMWRISVYCFKLSPHKSRK